MPPRIPIGKITYRLKGGTDNCIYVEATDHQNPGHPSTRMRATKKNIKGSGIPYIQVENQVAQGIILDFRIRRDSRDAFRNPPPNYEFSVAYGRPNMVELELNDDVLDEVPNTNPPEYQSRTLHWDLRQATGGLRMCPHHVETRDFHTDGDIEC